jgi:hypothetical protein
MISIINLLIEDKLPLEVKEMEKRISKGEDAFDHAEHKSAENVTDSKGVLRSISDDIEKFGHASGGPTGYFGVKSSRVVPSKEESEKVRNKAVNSFNKTVGEKVL